VWVCVRVCLCEGVSVHMRFIGKKLDSFCSLTEAFLITEEIIRSKLSVVVNRILHAFSYRYPKFLDSKTISKPLQIYKPRQA